MLLPNKPFILELLFIPLLRRFGLPPEEDFDDVSIPLKSSRNPFELELLFKPEPDFLLLEDFVPLKALLDAAFFNGIVTLLLCVLVDAVDVVCRLLSVRSVKTDLDDTVCCF